MKLQLNNITRLLFKAKLKEIDNLLMQRWMLHHSREMSFEEFKNELIHHGTDTDKTDEEILKDVKNIIDTFNGKVVK